MADDAEDVKDEGQDAGAATPPVTAPPPDPRIDAMQAQLTALNDTVAASLAARNVQSPGGDASGITPQLRQALRQKGLSDADITHNAPLILPFVELFAPELVALVESRVGGVDERLSAKEMEDDVEQFPYAKGLRTEIKKVMADAKKSGQPISTVAAYHTAVSTNIEKVTQIAAQSRANSRGADASALDGLGHRTSSGMGRRSGTAAGPKTKADLDTMTREERIKYFDTVGDTVIH